MNTLPRTLPMTSQKAARFEYHIPVEGNGGTAVDQLAAVSGMSKQRVKQAMQKGAAWLTRGKRTRRVRRAKTLLKAGDTLHLYYDEKVLQAEPPTAALIADERAYSVWDKPYGMLSQGSKWGDHCTVGRWAERHLAPPRTAYIVHRLDRAASGLILLAHTKTAAAKLSEIFRSRTVDKRYRVKVSGAFPATPDITTATMPVDNKAAISQFKRLSYDATHQQSLLEARIETGRKHQIRRHLAELGFPVVGDRLYGKTETDRQAILPDLQLQAYALAFVCPLTGEERNYQLANPLR